MIKQHNQKADDYWLLKLKHTYDGNNFLVGILLISLTIIFFLSNADASILEWGPAAENVTGFRLYYGESEGNYTNSEDMGMETEYSTSALPLSENATYFFVVRAYNAAGESENSNEISWNVSDDFSSEDGEDSGCFLKVIAFKCQDIGCFKEK